MCIYAQFVATAKKALQAQGTPQVKVATVVNFPHGSDNAAAAAQETREAVAAGADEIDVVLPYTRLIAGDEEACKELLVKVKAECPADVLLKVSHAMGSVPRLPGKGGGTEVEARRRAFEELLKVQARRDVVLFGRRL